MPKTGVARFKAAMTLAPGAVATGVGREIIGAKINPTWTNVPVAKAAYVMDGVGVVLGGLLEVAGAMMDQPVLNNLGAGVWIPSMAYLTQNVTHDVRRKMTKTTVTAAAPRQVMLAQPASDEDRQPAQAMLSAAVPVLREEPLSEDF